jgi:hypothetical protein
MPGNIKLSNNEQDILKITLSKTIKDDSSISEDHFVECTNGNLRESKTPRPLGGPTSVRE